nr:unnamed protein product [Callosobruchus analis]
MSSESESEDPFAGYDSDKDKEYFPSESDSNENEDPAYENGENLVSVSQIPRTSYGIHNTIGNSNKDVCGLPKNNSIQSVIPVEIEHYRITDSNDIERVQVEAECEFDKNVQKRRSRKRERNPSAWAVNLRKEKRNRGELYVSSRKKLMPARSIQNLKDCSVQCRNKCSTYISEDKRKEIFEGYYKLTKEKKLFLLANTTKQVPERRRKSKCEDNSKKKASFHFYFTIDSKRIQVCKSYFLGTLSISQKSIYTVYMNSRNVGNTPARSVQGKHTKHSIPEDAKQLIRDHIESVPKIDSHYCRADTTRQYMESSLNIAKLYKLYVNLMQEKGKTPSSSLYTVTFSVRSTIFIFNVLKKIAVTYASS